VYSHVLGVVGQLNAATLEDNWGIFMLQTAKIATSLLNVQEEYYKISFLSEHGVVCVKQIDTLHQEPIFRNNDINLFHSS